MGRVTTQFVQTELVQGDHSPPSAEPQVSIIVPTFNEASNLPEFFDRLLAFVRESRLSVETIVVDDASPDGTGVLAEQLAIKHNGTLSARVIHRPGKLGLSSALFDGIQTSRGSWVAMLDADNSHDIRSLQDMWRAARDDVDVVIGSRYVRGGRIEDWPLNRRLVSRGATWLARTAFRLEVKDPMAGFALLRRETAVRMSDLRNPRAYKFLLELLVRAHGLRVQEVPITFRNRKVGHSKLTPREFIEFARLMVSLMRSHLHDLRSRRASP